MGFRLHGVWVEGMKFMGFRVSELRIQGLGFKV